MNITAVQPVYYKKVLVHQEVRLSGLADDAYDVAGAIDWLERIREHAPAEYQKKLLLGVSAEENAQGEPVFRVSVYYNRPLTDQEKREERLLYEHARDELLEQAGYIFDLFGVEYDRTGIIS